MSIEKQKLYNEIETLPEELTNQVINFIEYLKISYIDAEAPESVEIKSKKYLKEKLQKGLDDIKANKVYSLDEFFTKIEKIYRNKDYRKKYHLKNMPSNEFIDMVLNVFDNKSYESLEKLYDYVMGDFKITDFVLRTEL